VTAEFVSFLESRVIGDWLLPFQPEVVTVEAEVSSQGLMVVGKANPDEEVLRAIVDSAFTGLS
jgi:hypothetical protein